MRADLARLAFVSFVEALVASVRGRLSGVPWSLVIVFLVTVAVAGTLGKLFDGVEISLWQIVVAGLATPIFTRYRARALSPLLSSAVVFAGVLALRVVAIFGAQN